MSRWNPDESLERPWQMLREMRGSGDGYRISGANPKGDSIGIYCSRADLDLIIEAVNAYETLRAENARYREALGESEEALKIYREGAYRFGIEYVDLLPLIEELKNLCDSSKIKDHIEHLGTIAVSWRKEAELNKEYVDELKAENARYREALEHISADGENVPECCYEHSKTKTLSTHFDKVAREALKGTT